MTATDSRRQKCHAQDRLQPSRLYARQCGLVITAAVALPTTLMAWATSRFSGRVENAVSGDALRLARINVEGSNFEVFSHEFGDTRIFGVPAGEAKLVVNYTGLSARTNILEGTL